MRTPDSSGDEPRAAAQLEGLDVTLLALDVEHDHSVAHAIGAAMERSGHIDVLVNNAGIGSLSSIEEVSMEDAKAIFETNVFGALRTTQAVLPSNRGGGGIVNVTSISGHLVGGGHGIYSSSKYALEAMSEALAIEIRRYGIRVIIIEPDFIVTPILDKAKPLEADGPYIEVLGRMRAVYTHARGSPAERGRRGHRARAGRLGAEATLRGRGGCRPDPPLACGRGRRGVDRARRRADGRGIPAVASESLPVPGVGGR